VLIADYYLIKKRRVVIDDLYTLESTGKYYYKTGYNPIAVALRRPRDTDPVAAQTVQAQARRTGRAPRPDLEAGRRPGCGDPPRTVLLSRCGSDLSGAAEVNCSRRQVFDIPPIKVHVTEHQIISRRCDCGKTSTGGVPTQATAPVQYGPVMCAVIIYLFTGQFLSKKRTAQAISELFGIPVSDGTAAAATSRAAADLTEFLAQVTARLKASAMVHFDETGLRCEGRNRWLHSASTPMWTRLFFHRKRGTEALSKMNIPPDFIGTAVHDAWAPYDTYTAARHALCNAHLLRELQAVTDHHDATTATTGAWCWAQQISHALLTLHKAAAAHPDTPVDPAIITTETTKIRHALLAATHPAGALGRKHRALARRIHRREADYLQFAHNPRHPLHQQPRRTRNPHDQDPAENIRHHAHRKGAEHFADLRSYLQTTANTPYQH